MDFIFSKFKNWDPAHGVAGFRPYEFVQISLVEHEKYVSDWVLFDKLNVFNTDDSMGF